MKTSEAFRQAAIECGYDPAEVDRRMKIMRTMLPVVDRELKRGTEREVINRLRTMFVVGGQLYEANPDEFCKAVDRDLKQRSLKN